MLKICNSIGGHYSYGVRFIATYILGRDDTAQEHDEEE